MTTERPTAPTDDDAVAGLLTDALGALPDRIVPADDPVPRSVLDGALWVHDWLNMEAELAELTFDSAEDRELAGVRASGSLRELTFVTDDHTLDLEIEPGPRTAIVSGTIDPPTSGSVQLVVGGEVFTAEIDAHGAYAVRDVAFGTVLAFVETPTGRIRLGAFEI